MQVRVKKLSLNAVIPKYAKNGDAGLDLTATSITDGGELYQEYGTGLAFEIPEGYVGLVFPRSSISKYYQILANSVGVIDSSYRGEVKLRFRCGGDELYKVGDKVGQIIIVPYPQVQLIESKELTETARGQGGFGSSGK